MVPRSPDTFHILDAKAVAEPWRSLRTQWAARFLQRRLGRNSDRRRSTSVRRQGLPFTDKQIALLKTFADQAVIAIENVRLFKELQARNAEITEALEQQTATAEILKVISSSPTDTQPVFEAILDNAMRLCDGHMGALQLYDGERLSRGATTRNAQSSPNGSPRSRFTPASSSG